MSKEKKKYEAPKAEQVQMVSDELLESMQKALTTATDTINKLKESANTNNDKYLRALADYQNLQKRTVVQVSNAKLDGKISLFKELIPVLDTFENAMNSEEVSEGVKLIYNQLKSVFTKNGVIEIPAEVGGSFDDSIHEAIAAIPVEEDKKNTIIYIQYKGYKLGDNILRYSKVGVGV